MQWTMGFCRDNLRNIWILGFCLIAATGCTSKNNSNSNNELQALTASYNVLPDVAFSGSLSAVNKTSADITFLITQSPSKGNLVLDDVNSGAFTYTADSGTTGSDTFVFKVSNGTSESAVAVVTMHISEATPRPVANNDTATVNEGGVVIIPVLSNDTHDGSDFTNSLLTIIEQHNGVASVNDVNGTVTFTHNGSETLSADFLYTVTDAKGITSNQARVDITVMPINDAPVAVNDNANLLEGGSVSITILTNDSDVDGNIDPASIVITTPTAYGSLNVNTITGIVSYVHNGGEFFTDSFSYRVKDNSGATSNTAMVNISITPVNDPPVAIGSCGSTPQEMSLVSTLTGSDAEGAVIFKLGTNGSAGNGPITTAKGAQVQLTNNTTGDYTYTPKLTAGGNPRGEDSFAFQVVDINGAIANATEKVIVDQKIMPLGDSITLGTVSAGDPGAGKFVGWRQVVQNKLDTTGYFYDFVGQCKDGLSASPPIADPDHDGHGGWTAGEIAFGQAAPSSTLCPSVVANEGIRGWLARNPADIVILHAGTNGFTTSTSDIANILNEIDAWEVSAGGNPVTVVLAKIIDHKDLSADVTTFNANLAALVASRTSDNIILVDQQSALWGADGKPDLTLYNTVDVLHPNPAGYAKMADVWLYPLTGSATIGKKTGSYTGPGILKKCP